MHSRLLDYMTNLLSSNHDMLKKIKFGVLLSYIASCANGNYVPPGFDKLKPLILTRLNVQKVLKYNYYIVILTIIYYTHHIYYF